MKPTNGYVIGKADLDQKKHHKVAGTDIELYIETDFNNNYRERNPTYSTVVYTPESDTFKDWENRSRQTKVKTGDVICTQHFQLVDDRRNSKAIFKEGEDDLFLIDLREVYFVDTESGPSMVGNYALCEYYGDLERVSTGGVYIPELAREAKRRSTKLAKIVILPDNNPNNLKVGDIVYYLDFADYKLTYKDREYIKISVDEMVAVYEQ